jgi:inorganic triphosphatase YgiF
MPKPRAPDSHLPASESHVELELKLVARDAGVLDEVAELTDLAGYRLHEEPQRAIRDRYWDTPGGALSNRGCSLRVRVQDSTQRLTLKRSGSVAEGLFRHPELELPASYESWLTVRVELDRQGISLPAAGDSGGGIADTLAAAGLEITQDRSTVRRVLRAELDRRAVVELSLDTTTYHLGYYNVVFHEIEAEALSGEVQHVLSLGRALQQAFDGRVHASERNKYARGLELAARLAGI